MTTLTLEEARRTWWSKQALDAPKGNLAEVLAGSGWLRTLGGADVYLAARARRPGLSRGDLDSLIAQDVLVVRPAARGCIYVVPPGAVPDLMADNEVAWRKDTEKTLGKIGRKIGEIEKLAPVVLAALKSGPLDTNALRKALPGDALPSFGDAGKKVGLSSPLPLALRYLEFAGKVERTLDGGRLDTERYLWRARKGKVPVAERDPVRRLASLIDAFLGFAGPATLAQLSAWTGRAQKDLKAALAKADAVEVTVESLGASWIRRGDVGAKRRPPAGIALLAFEDNYLVPHGLAVVTDPKHHAIETDIWGGSKPETLGEADHVLSRTIVIDGLIAGFWEVDPTAKGGTWATFEPAKKALAKQLDERVADTARFLLDDIGHARSFSLDTMDEVQARANRIKAFRKKAG